MTNTPSSGSGPSGKGRRKTLLVVSSDGRQRRFLRGMVTHDLVLRGLGFEAAYAMAQTVRDQLADRDEVSTVELRELIREELERLFDGDIPSQLLEPVKRVSDLQVMVEGQAQPFSRGLLARSIQASGVGLDRAYLLVTELESELSAMGSTALTSGDLARQVGDLLERSESSGTALRYRTIRRIHKLPRPLVIYIAGASGTGKSTLALELAPLLRIYRLNATDTIRQVMRMVFTPSILPALHSSSFEAAPLHRPPGSASDSDGEPLLIGSYEEQARRVCVGVRAVVERAIAENMSIVVEGVHLLPGLVPFPDLEGSAHQIPLVLGTLDEEAHRARFIARSRAGRRHAGRYLENFTAIRSIQEHLLQQAELQDWPLLDTSGGEPPVLETLRVVTGWLEKSVPDIDHEAWSRQERSGPTLLLIIDGLPDRPIRALGNRTPMQAASTPTLDRLAREGQSGLADPVAPGVVADTAAGTLAILGQTPFALKRGPVEALGAEIPLSPGDIALRANLATLDGTGQVIDRRAGRIREGAKKLAAAIDRLSLPGDLAGRVDIRVQAGTEHRLAVVLRGEGLSSAIQGSDPGESAIPGPPLTPSPNDPENEAAVHTAAALALFEQKARRILRRHPVNRRRQKEGLPAANTILTRGAGRIHRLVPLEEFGLPLRITCISGDRTILGLTRWLGGRILTDETMTANLDTDLHRKFEAARKALEGNDLVVLHLKGADIAAHDQRPDLKTQYLERVDEELGQLLEKLDAPTQIAITSDHATLSESGQHAADPTPVLVWGPGWEPDDVPTYDEQAAGAGALQRFPLQMLLGRLFKLP
jgi:2,3-bisphosphoglycerate-independent phosphoglycerate mutase